MLIPECQKCPAINICGNGCAFNAGRLTGDVMNIDTEGCRISKEFYKEFQEDLKSLENKKKKLLGNLKIDPNNPLNHSIGHLSDFDLESIS